MKHQKHLIFLLTSFIILLPFFPYAQTAVVPVGGNTWKSDGDRSGGRVTTDGIVSWTNAEARFTTYVRVTSKGKTDVFIKAKSVEGTSKLRITAFGKSHVVSINDTDWKDYTVGEWEIKDTGYIAFVIEGVSKSGNRFADVASIHLSGSAINERTDFVKTNEGNFYYWGRRGPSVHLGYTVPQQKEIEWFYNEITVPKGDDVIGSYYMANGFAEGYFGIQVNSATERRILFSVWSPFHTDDPKKIPEDQKIIMLKKGDGVHTGEFGNEGSGGQSYLRYNWKAGNTYGFLLRGVPDGAAHTIYTAYFFAPEKGDWSLVASFRRPKSATYLKRLHSFLENFIPEQGNIERKVLFSNQWVRDREGAWHELTKARFTGDNTAAKRYRMDYAGGISNDTFYLRNCGFFSNYTTLNSWFERKATNRQPQIDLKALP
ncbi:MAG: DUF3472 domain-containing protein [Chitinophagaceae bacterium]